MARLFSINFNYRAEEKTAMVTVRKTAFFTEYTLGMLDETIEDQLPGNKIISTGGKHLIFANATLDQSNEVMQAILKAVASHLYSTAIHR